MKKIIHLIALIFMLSSCSSKYQSITIMEELGYGKNDILVIIHADDLGMFPGETDATIDSFKNGMVKSTSIMSPCPDFDRAIEILKANPQIDGGIHLTLNNEWQEGNPWSPVLSKEEVPTLYNDKGLMWQRENGFNANANLDEALLEMEAQIIKVLDTGYKPSHLDFHMGTVYQNPELLNGIMDMAKKYQIPMITAPFMYSVYRRMLNEKFLLFNYVNCIYKIDGEENDPLEVRKQTYMNELKSMRPGLNMFLIHPAYTEDTGNWLEMPYIRSGDYEVWNDPEVKAYAEELGIKFISYKPIAELQLKKWNEETTDDF